MMKSNWLYTLTIALSAQFLWAQGLTQTVRGTVVDVDSKFPLMGATVSIGDLKVVTDESGQFTLTAFLWAVKPFSLGSSATRTNRRPLN